MTSKKEREDMAKKVSNKNYITIADWMLDFHLNPRELLCYAIIYGFSQDQENKYYGSLSYLASFLGLGDHAENALRYLKSLEKKNLVIKEKVKLEAKQVRCNYSINVEELPKFKKKNINYIIIQPWMINDFSLTGKELLLYALVHGYSRNAFEPYCAYNKHYLAKWLDCRKDNVDRIVENLRALSLIEVFEISNQKFLKIHDPEEDNLTNFESTSCKPKNENTNPNFESTNTLKVKDNNITDNQVYILHVVDIAKANGIRTSFINKTNNNLIDACLDNQFYCMLYDLCNNLNPIKAKIIDSNLEELYLSFLPHSVLPKYQIKAIEKITDIVSGMKKNERSNFMKTSSENLVGMYCSVRDLLDPELYNEKIIYNIDAYVAQIVRNYVNKK